MSQYEVKCPNCNGPMLLEPQLIAEWVECPHCKAVVNSNGQIMPAPQPPPPPSPPAPPPSQPSAPFAPPALPTPQTPTAGGRKTSPWLVLAALAVIEVGVLIGVVQCAVLGTEGENRFGVVDWMFLLLLFNIPAVTPGLMAWYRRIRPLWLIASALVGYLSFIWFFVALGGAAAWGRGGTEGAGEMAAVSLLMALGGIILWLGALAAAMLKPTVRT